jgi:hypothetical protein
MVSRGQRNGSSRPLISIFWTWSRYFSIQVAPQLYSRGWVDPVPHLLTYGAEPFLRSRQLCSHSRTSQHGTWRFNAVFTKAIHWSLFWVTSIQFTPSRRSILILSTHLRLGLPSDLFPSPLLLRKSGSAKNRTRNLWICSRNSDH